MILDISLNILLRIEIDCLNYKAKHRNFRDKLLNEKDLFSDQRRMLESQQRLVKQNVSVNSFYERRNSWISTVVWIICLNNFNIQFHQSSSQRFGFIEDDKKQQIIKSSFYSVHEGVWKGAWLSRCLTASLGQPKGARGWWYKVHQCLHPLSFGDAEGPGFGGGWSEFLHVSVGFGWFSCQYWDLAGSETLIWNNLHHEVLNMQLPMQKICHWTILRENSCINLEAIVLILHFSAISYDILLYQLRLKIACEIIFQNSSFSNFIKVHCSINSLLKLKYLLKSSK